MDIVSVPLVINSTASQGLRPSLQFDQVGYQGRSPWLFRNQGSVSVHGPLVGCVGTVGGVFHGTFWKSKNSLISNCAASRLVKLGKLKRVSISFKMAVLSAGVCETKFFLLKGETTIIGIRNPLRLKSPGGSGGLVVNKSLGGTPSGLGTDCAVESLE